MLIGNTASYCTKTDWIDLIAHDDVDVYVTGSNAELLSKDIVTEFRGRGDEVRVASLAFGERVYVQSACDLPDSEKLAQEQRSLLKTGDSFRKAIVVGKPIERHYTDDGVLLLSVYDIMLDESAPR